MISGRELIIRLNKSNEQTCAEVNRQILIFFGKDKSKTEECVSEDIRKAIEKAIYERERFERDAFRNIEMNFSSSYIVPPISEIKSIDNSELSDIEDKSDQSDCYSNRCSENALQFNETKVSQSTKISTKLDMHAASLGKNKIQHFSQEGEAYRESTSIAKQKHELSDIDGESFWLYLTKGIKNHSLMTVENKQDSLMSCTLNEVGSISEFTKNISFADRPVDIDPLKTDSNNSSDLNVLKRRNDLFSKDCKNNLSEVKTINSEDSKLFNRSDIIKRVDSRDNSGSRSAKDTNSIASTNSISSQQSAICSDQVSNLSEVILEKTKKMCNLFELIEDTMPPSNSSLSSSIIIPSKQRNKINSNDNQIDNQDSKSSIISDHSERHSSRSASIETIVKSSIELGQKVATYLFQDKTHQIVDELELRNSKQIFQDQQQLNLKIQMLESQLNEVHTQNINLKKKLFHYSEITNQMLTDKMIIQLSYFANKIQKQRLSSKIKFISPKKTAKYKHFKNKFNQLRKHIRESLLTNLNLQEEIIKAKAGEVNNDTEERFSQLKKIQSELFFVDGPRKSCMHMERSNEEKIGQNQEHEQLFLNENFDSHEECTDGINVGDTLDTMDYSHSTNTRNNFQLFFRPLHSSVIELRDRINLLETTVDKYIVNLESKNQALGECEISKDNVVPNCFECIENRKKIMSLDQALMEERSNCRFFEKNVDELKEQLILDPVKVLLSKENVLLKDQISTLKTTQTYMKDLINKYEKPKFEVQKCSSVCQTPSDWIIVRDDGKIYIMDDSSDDDIDINSYSSRYETTSHVDNYRECVNPIFLAPKYSPTPFIIKFEPLKLEYSGEDDDDHLNMVDHNKLRMKITFRNEVIKMLKVRCQIIYEQMCNFKLKFLNVRKNLKELKKVKVRLASEKVSILSEYEKLEHDALQLRELVRYDQQTLPLEQFPINFQNNVMNDIYMGMVHIIEIKDYQIDSLL